MTTFDSELVDGLEVVLGTRPPEPEYEPQRFVRHWLAERNLGLVPIANAGHLSHIEAPGAFLRAVTSFVGTQGETRAP